MPFECDQITRYPALFEIHEVDFVVIEVIILRYSFRRVDHCRHTRWNRMMGAQDFSLYLLLYRNVLI